jgi:hypothetical protein
MGMSVKREMTDNRTDSGERHGTIEWILDRLGEL